MEGFNSVIYGPVSYTWQNVTYSQYGVIASNKYNAAAVALGYNPDNFSSEVKAKLSNSSTGGSFYIIAQEFENPDPDGLSVTVQGVAPGFWATAYGLYGEGNVWYAELTKTAITSATEDLQTILNGGSLGGGSLGDTVESGQYVFVPVSEMAPNAPYQITHIRFKKEAWESFVSYAQTNSHDKFVGCFTRDSFALTIGCPYTVTDSSGYYLDDDGTVKNALDRSYCLVFFGPTFTAGYIPNASYSGQPLEMDGMRYYVNDNNYRTIQINRSINGSWPIYYQYGLTGGGDPVTPPTNWPDTPTVGTPEPPEVPAPVNDTPTPQPTGPTFVISPTFPTYTEVTTTNYTVDLQGILDAMNDHCIHLQDALHWNFDHFWTVLSTKWTNDLSTFKTFLDGQFGWIGDTIVDQMEQTRDYLKELFEWLADQLAFESGGSYNDSTVISWLKKIYSKLGTGNNSRPTDPVADPVETGSWLDTLINNLLVALGSLFPSLIGGVTDFFSGVVDSAGDLTKKFPVSLPWDIAALLALLVAEPVAPVFDIPCYTLGANGLSQVGTYHITLEDYGTAWEGVRVAMLIGFAVYLAAHTKDFLDVIEGVLL